MSVTETHLNKERLEKILKDGYFELEDELKGSILTPRAVTEAPYFTVGKDTDTGQSMIVGISVNMDNTPRIKKLLENIDIGFFDETEGDDPTVDLVRSRYIDS